jgi:prepilin-type N-terminal cleavage/methylation domain-containing protein
MRSDGFSFIEVTAAMVILSISLVILLGSQSQSMNLVDRAESLDYATTLASTKMAELVQEANVKGVTALKDAEAGEFNQEIHPGYRWNYRIVPVPSPDFAALMGVATGQEEGLGEVKDNSGNAALFAGPLQMIGKVWGQALRELHVEVTWGEGKSQKSYELVTHLITNDAVAQIQGLIGGVNAAFGGAGGGSTGGAAGGATGGSGGAGTTGGGGTGGIIK